MDVLKRNYFPQTSRCWSRNGHGLTFGPVEAPRQPCPHGDLLTYCLVEVLTWEHRRFENLFARGPHRPGQ